MIGYFPAKPSLKKLALMGAGNVNSIFFDVQRLIELAKTDPSELERLRLLEIENLINQAPERTRKRLRGLQFQIDCKRRLHKNPLAACVEISRMMMDSLHCLNLAIQGDFKSPVENASLSATIIDFPASAN